MLNTSTTFFLLLSSSSIFPPTMDKRGFKDASTLFFPFLVSAPSFSVFNLHDGWTELFLVSFLNFVFGDRIFVTSWRTFIFSLAGIIPQELRPIPGDLKRKVAYFEKWTKFSCSFLYFYFRRPSSPFSLPSIICIPPSVSFHTSLPWTFPIASLDAASQSHTWSLLSPSLSSHCSQHWGLSPLCSV